MSSIIFLLVSICAISLASANIFRVPLEHRVINRTYIPHSSIDGDLMASPSQRTEIAVQTSGSMYIGRIEVGSLPADVVFNTASKIMWVFDEAVKKQLTKRSSFNFNFYSKRKSKKTYKDFDPKNAPFSLPLVEGGTSASLDGVMGLETITMGGFEVKSSPFVRVDHVHIETGGDNIQYDGEMGLEFGKVANTAVSPLVKLFKDNKKAVKQRVVFFNLFSPERGEVIVGGVDASACSQPLVYTSVDSHETQWALSIAMKLKGVQYDQIKAHFDTSSEFIYAPPSMVSRIIELSNGGVTGSQADQPFIIECDKAHTLPDLELVIGGKSRPLTSSDYFRQDQKDTNSCELLVREIRGGGVWLGIPFFRKYVAAFDFASPPRIGLAPGNGKDQNGKEDHNQAAGGKKKKRANKSKRKRKRNEGEALAFV